MSWRHLWPNRLVASRGTEKTCAMLCQVWRRAVARLKLEPERKATRAMRLLTLAMF